MKNIIPVKTFGRVISSTEGKADLGFALSSVNFHMIAKKLKFRRGYSPVVAAPGGSFAVYGFGFVTNTSGTSEFIGVENHGGTINAYKYDKTTLARTAIGASTVAGGDWVISAYKDNAYLINPGGTASVYRHVIGDNSSLVAVENSGYVASNTPDLTVTMNQPTVLKAWSDTDTYVYTGANTYTLASITDTGNADGSLLLNGPSEDHAANGGELLIEVTYGASTYDFSGNDYIYVELVGENYLQYFTTQNTLPSLYYSAGWHTVTDAKLVKSDAATKRAVWIMYVNGMTLTAVGGMRIPVPLKPNRSEPAGPRQNFLTLQPVYQAGTYLEATANTKRIWDTVKDGDGVRYAARYYHTGTLAASNITEIDISKDQALGYTAASYSGVTGGKPLLESDAPSGSYNSIQFLRYHGTDWNLLSTVTSAPWVYSDKYREYDFPTTTISVGSTNNAPVFSTDGIVGAFPFKQFMIWLINTGESNIQMSRVGDAEEMYSSDATYDANDLTQPSQRTLADGGDDKPIWGTQMGNVALIVGSLGAYVMDGDYPSTMSPTRLIAGSRGIIGRYAGVRYRVLNGQYAAAYCDPDFNVWLVQAVPQFAGDGRGQPIELSMPVRGKIKEFLYTEQLVENSSLNTGNVNLEFDEESSTLWVILGNRACAYRQDTNDEGWEFYKYNLRGESAPTTFITDYTGNSASASSVTPGDAAFSNFGYPFVSDDAYCSSASIPSGTKTTETLRLDGFTPETLIPANATLTKVRYKTERSQTGDVPVIEATVQPRKGGASWGSNLSTSIGLTSSDLETIWEISSGLPTISEANSGALGIDLKYSATSHADWFDASKYTISVAGATTLSPTVNVTYTGALPKPPSVKVSISSGIDTGITPDPDNPPSVAPGNGSVTLNNGLGDTGSGAIGGVPDYHASVNGTHTVTIPLTAGVGSYSLTKTVGVVRIDYGYKTSTTCTCTASFVSGSLATVRVDNVNVQFEGTVPAASATWVGWDHVCFTADGRRVGIRTTGEIDLLEKDFRNGSYIEGSNRDGGYAPPDATWESQNLEINGYKSFVAGIQVSTLNTDDSFSVATKIPSANYVNGFSTGYSTSRWYRFPLSQTGTRSNIKLTVPETDGGIEALAIELQQQSKYKTV